MKIVKPTRRGTYRGNGPMSVDGGCSNGLGGTLVVGIGGDDGANADAMNGGAGRADGRATGGVVGTAGIGGGGMVSGGFADLLTCVSALSSSSLLSYIRRGGAAGFGEIEGETETSSTRFCASSEPPD